MLGGRKGVLPGDMCRICWVRGLGQGNNIKPCMRKCWECTEVGRRTWEGCKGRMKREKKGQKGLVLGFYGNKSGVGVWEHGVCVLKLLQLANWAEWTYSHSRNEANVVPLPWMATQYAFKWAGRQLYIDSRLSRKKVGGVCHWYSTTSMVALVYCHSIQPLVWCH